MGFLSFLFGKKKKADTEAEPYEVKQDVNAEPVKEEIAENAVAEEPKNEAPKPKKATQPKKPTQAKKPEAAPTPAECAVEPAKEEPTPKRVTYTGRFEIKRTKDDRFVFNLFAANRVIVATSQIYSSSQAAVNGIKSIINNAEKSGVEDNTLKEKVTLPYPKWEIYQDKAGQYRFRLYATNGSCVVHSQGYTTKASCKNGIDSIIRCSKNPEIDKAYLKKKEEE